VVSCKIYWQNMGDYLCVKVDRYKKSSLVKEDDGKEAMRYSGLYYNFEIFRIREKEIPVDSLELRENNCYSFAWEPNGLKFGIIYGDSPMRTSAAFYKMVNAQVAGGKLEQIGKELKGRSVTQLSWSPQGEYCVLATTATKAYSSGLCVAEFYDVQSNDVVLLNQVEHEHMSDFEWDPTGRYVVTYVSYWNHRTDNAYQLWNFQGKPLHKVSIDKLYKFSWRPRPQNMLATDQVKEIRKNLKQYSEKYINLDRIEDSEVSKEQLEKRRRLMEDFNLFRRTASKRNELSRTKRIELRDGVDTDTLKHEEEIECQVELLVETKREEVSWAAQTERNN